MFYLVCLILTQKALWERWLPPREERWRVSATILIQGTSKSTPVPTSTSALHSPSLRGDAKQEHHLNQGQEFSRLTREQVLEWLKNGRKCWWYACNHLAAACNLKKPCSKSKHLIILHKLNQKPRVWSHNRNCCHISCSSRNQFNAQDTVDQSSVYNRVLREVVRVNLHYRDKVLDTYVWRGFSLERKKKCSRRDGAEE